MYYEPRWRENLAEKLLLLKRKIEKDIAQHENMNGPEPDSHHTDAIVIDKEGIASIDQILKFMGI